MKSKTQKAKITKKEYTGKIRENRKESSFYAEYAVIFPHMQKPKITRGRAHAAIVLRLYGTAQRNYACLWINASAGLTGKESVYIGGGGYAGGYGYHRPSAAAESAIRDAGIVLSQSIGGVGDSAIEGALSAIAAALCKKQFFIHYSHA